MIDVLFEQRIIQNTSLAAETIWQAVQEAHEIKGRAEGVTFPLVFLVLPLTFHQRTAFFLSSKSQPGSIYKAISEDREIIVGLQARMQSFSEKTFQALSISFHTDLLKLDQKNHYQLIPGRKTPPVEHQTEDVKIILKAAKRVGQAISELSVTQISNHLGVTF